MSDITLYMFYVIEANKKKKKYYHLKNIAFASIILKYNIFSYKLYIIRVRISIIFISHIKIKKGISFAYMYLGYLFSRIHIFT